MPEHGPFQTEREASQTAAVRAVYAAFDADPGRGKMHPHNLRILQDACDAAGVELGDWDLRVLAGMANWEPETCVVIAGIIRRAAQLPEGTVTAWGLRLTLVDPPGEPAYEKCPSEAAARSAVQVFRGPFEVALVSHQVGPWTEAPAPETAEENHGE